MTVRSWSMSAVMFGVLAGSAPAPAQEGPVLFKQRCAMCHTTTPGARPGIGPNLAGLAGRQAASTPFLYSEALKKSGLKWDKATLDTFLTLPGRMVPGTRMVSSVPDAAQRGRLVAYLMTSKK